MDVQNVIRAPICNPTGYAAAAVGVGISALGAYYQTRYAKYGDFGYTNLWQMLSPCITRNYEMPFERKLFVKNLSQAWTVLEKVQQEAEEICGKHTKVEIEPPYGDLTYRCKVYNSEENLSTLLGKQAFKTSEVVQDCHYAWARDFDKMDFSCDTPRAYYIGCALSDAPIAMVRSREHIPEMKANWAGWTRLDFKPGQCSLPDDPFEAFLALLKDAAD